MDVQVADDHPYHWSVGVGHAHQPAHLVGEVLHGALFRDRDVAPAGPGLAEQEDIAGSGSAIRSYWLLTVTDTAEEQLALVKRKAL